MQGCKHCIFPRHDYADVDDVDDDVDDVDDEDVEKVDLWKKVNNGVLGG